MDAFITLFCSVVMGGCLMRPKKLPLDVVISDLPIHHLTNKESSPTHVNTSETYSEQRGSALGTQLPPLPDGTVNDTPSGATVAKKQNVTTADASAVSAPLLQTSDQSKCNNCYHSDSPQHVVQLPQAQHAFHQIIPNSVSKGSVPALELQDVREIHACLQDSASQSLPLQHHSSSSTVDSPMRSSQPSARGSLQRNLLVAIFFYVAKTDEELSIQRGDQLFLLNQALVFDILFVPLISVTWFLFLLQGFWLVVCGTLSIWTEGLRSCPDGCVWEIFGVFWVSTQMHSLPERSFHLESWQCDLILRRFYQKFRAKGLNKKFAESKHKRYTADPI